MQKSQPRRLPVQDLSSLAKGSLAMSSSMAGGNVISEIPKFGAAGSLSEQTADLPYDPQHNDPEPQIGMPSGEHTDTKTNDAGVFRTTPRVWKDCP
jgi:hypothetical protein